MTTAADLARNLALAWWQPVLLVAVVYFGPRLIVKALCALDFRRTFDDLGSPDAWGIDDLLDGDTWAARQGLVPMPPPDAPDEAFEAWADQALHLANDHSFDRTLDEIRALPERKTA